MLAQARNRWPRQAVLMGCVASREEEEELVYEQVGGRRIPTQKKKNQQESSPDYDYDPDDRITFPGCWSFAASDGSYGSGVSWD